MDLAILLLIWKRPEHAKRVIESIKKVAPKRIYISSDGPIINDKNNQRLVSQTRDEVIDQINWECQIFTNFSEENQGCKLAVTKGINWFFENENEGIILEDDCLPNIYFYEFCRVLLEKYRNDNRVWTICGNGYQDKNSSSGESYFLSKYVDVWGWATWKRCWKYYDKDIRNWEINRSRNILKNVFAKRKDLNFWKRIFDDLFYKGEPDTWDYQWQYACFINSGMSCMPYVNLVENIGFGREATHTLDIPITAKLKVNKLGKITFPLKHPEVFLKSNDCDEKLENEFFSGYPITSLIGLKLKLKKLFYKLRKFIFNKRNSFKN